MARTWLDYCKFPHTIWKRLLSLGAGGNPDARYIVATNAVVLISGLFTVIYYVIFTIFGVYFPLWLYLLWIVNVAGYACVLWCNVKQRHRSARVLLAIAGCMQLFMISSILPPEAGLDLYIIASFALPFYIFPPEEKIFIYAMETILALLFVLVHILPYFFEPILELDPGYRSYFYFTSLVLVIAWFSFIGKELAQAAWAADLSLKEEKEKTELLLLNILPKETAEELKRSGTSEPRLITQATVLFTDFYGFTSIAEKLTPNELVKELDFCFRHFDSVTETHRLEKLKTIGDAYMCVAGVPTYRSSHAVDSLLAAMEMTERLEELAELKAGPGWTARIGVHSGPLVAGVIGARKFSYDVWGDTVNLASRMESNSEPGKVNVSQAVVNLTKDFFLFKSRGRIPVKNKGRTAMFFLTGLRKEYREKNNSSVPNARFWEDYGYRFGRR
ncbi:adenylate/guanylate cyclase domain-containing protein [Leptospira wolffii]|uniref:adenylate/guanylate cyclase domain-containing protein n=1 Tax=Leptospira wolffii TaxID=409998 RepID=UPI0003480EBE|nr:adenylate/guanylate cyclase domain-containing protein [Leptospira wolffii]TGK58209.1 adenylate/guanylate cyclase domain-containing protein [Leptospira wolffii]TGK67427.1 adenylate/guanylate cyclase domain-containing protein [Leptospira wolffii]TGK68887.1 adenylate/guanylate cyclase domain-containing protein [Leptospira wolffii]TGL27239.1 adenylate/guanylate cyclase domain-containing protein [Leptospira wolffii]